MACMVDSRFQDQGPPKSLQDERLRTVIQHLLVSGAKTVLDLGCGTGDLIERMSELDQFQRIVGIDTSAEALTIARERIRLPNSQRISLLQESFTQTNEQLKGFDAAVMIETIEHIPSTQLSAVEFVVFSGFNPKTVIITTPNQEFNVFYGLPKGRFRLPGHQFEWNRAKFRSWARGVANRNKYSVTFVDIGEVSPAYGSPTQMAEFKWIP